MLIPQLLQKGGVRPGDAVVEVVPRDCECVNLVDKAVVS